MPPGKPPVQVEIVSSGREIPEFGMELRGGFDPDPVDWFRRTAI